MSEKLADPISLRFPAELRGRIDRAAKQTGRSLNAEIRMRLEWSFDTGFGGGQRANGVDQASELETLHAQVRALENRVPVDLVERLRKIDALFDKLEGKVVVGVEDTLKSATDDASKSSLDRPAKQLHKKRAKL